MKLTARQYKQLVQVLDILIDRIGNDQHHPMAPLIEAYEDKYLPEPQPDPIEVLKSLMAEHNLKQKDMKEIGSQGVVSEVLNGKRTLNTHQIRALAKRFHVSSAVFV